MKTDNIIVRQYIRANKDDTIKVFACNERNYTVREYILPESDYSKHGKEIEEARKLIGQYPNQVQITGSKFVFSFDSKRRI
jgi:hypothetical protein